jgi:hypothetical protein
MTDLIGNARFVIIIAVNVNKLALTNGVLSVIIYLDLD